MMMMIIIIILVCLHFFVDAAGVSYIYEKPVLNIRTQQTFLKEERRTRRRKKKKKKNQATKRFAALTIIQQHR
jgi:hypothetical protein